MKPRVVLLSLSLLVLIILGMFYYVSLAREEATITTAPNITTSTSSTARESVVAEDGTMFTVAYRLPLLGSAPTENLSHTIPLEDIRRGCFRQDCIPSVDTPEFTTASNLVDTLAPDTLGIILHEAERFYPFPMLETREIVNDVLPNGQPVAVTYCPLCGTGIVFSRELQDGTIREFGVSGMLWQSNLLMYDRADSVADRNLWSQVLGQAVVGDRAGEMLAAVPSDIITFADWLATNPNGMTLDTGRTADPYNGDYYGTAQFFEPDFDAATSPIEPMQRVHGIVVNGQPKAYVSANLLDGMTDIVAGERIFVEREATNIRFITPNAETGNSPTALPDIEGFWFSWVAAHPDTELWLGE